MRAAVCTLFEKHYHHGVMGLVNSLARRGFRGTIYAGFRGALPPWAAAAKPAAASGWPAACELSIDGDCTVALIPLHTDAHFTNFKPQFMLQVFGLASPPPDVLFYLDPDICVASDWPFFADWSSCGIALCEDVNSPLGEDHPRRVGWRRHFAEHGLHLRFRSPQYVNGGCVGVTRADLKFLENWQSLTELMARIIGGLDTAKIEGGADFRAKGFASCFDCSDQDTLNAAIEMTDDVRYSVLPQAAMGFAPGAPVLPHALGPRKPWRRAYLLDALSGVAPRAADKAFWSVADGPVRSMSAGSIMRARTTLTLAALIARFYRRA
jgi:hypothetical protein